MRLETFPLILGILVALAGLAIVVDALMPERARVLAERRRRARPERRRGGQLMLGVGILLLAVALIGRDAWRYTTLTILVALIAMGIGTALNLKYVRGLTLGPVLGARRTRRASDQVTEETKRERLRIR